MIYFSNVGFGPFWVSFHSYFQGTGVSILLYSHNLTSVLSRSSSAFLYGTSWLWLACDCSGEDAPNHSSDGGGGSGGKGKCRRCPPVDANF